MEENKVQPSTKDRARRQSKKKERRRRRNNGEKE